MWCSYCGIIMKYYSITVSNDRTAEYSLFLEQNYIMPRVDYTVVPASRSTVEYRFVRYDHFSQFISRWAL
jgi:hypothetical protein